MTINMWAKDYLALGVGDNTIEIHNSFCTNHTNTNMHVHLADSNAASTKSQCMSRSPTGVM
jgi:hypothetical protein